MSLILNIETGTDICSAALSQDGELIALRESSGGQEHARKLALYIDELLKGNDYEPEDLDAVAVGKGPGSYTGLRIGVSTAKGICYALGIPLIGIGSLEALANVAAEDHEAGILNVEDWATAKLCPMIDARRMEVYTQIFDSTLNAITEPEARIITADSFSEFIDGKREFVIFGNGAAKCVETLPEQGVIFANVAPSARGIVKPAFDAFRAGRFEDTAYFEPFYLKDFVITTSKKKLF